MTYPSYYRFPILDSSGNPTTTIVDMSDMFVTRDIFLNASLWGAGQNSYGGLGNGTNGTLYSSPIQI